MDENEEYEKYELKRAEFREQLIRELHQAKVESDKRFKRVLRQQLGFSAIVWIMAIAPIIQIFYPKLFVMTNWTIALGNITIAIVLFVQYLGCTWSKKWAAVLFAISILNMVIGFAKLI